MADPKKTILKSTQPSEENWQIGIGKRVVRLLKEKSALKGFSVRIKPTKTDSFLTGAVRAHTGKTIGEQRSSPSSRHYFGIEYTKEF